MREDTVDFRTAIARALEQPENDRARAIVLALGERPARGEVVTMLPTLLRIVREEGPAHV